MVFHCPSEYELTDINEYISNYSFPLSSWQKWSIHAITTGNHSLVTAPTGSGKTLPAEFTIEYFKKINKKVIYTSPIKALSNQKYYDFSNKFKDISFGLLTGDIKNNPNADVLIMTTEILRNNLYQAKSNDSKCSLDFDINIERDVGAIVFDEVHYINDADRGTVWEECFMLIPSCVQLIMLSATIDNPDKFASWIQNIHNTKEVYLSTTNIRAVPLQHHYWFSCNSNLLKLIKNKDYRDEIQKFLDKPHCIIDENKKFNEVLYHKLKSHINYLQKNQMYVKRQHTLNRVTDYLKKNELLPAIYFVYSRANAEKYAEEINFSLLDSYDDAHIPSIIQNECQKVLMKIPNYKEYINLPEYLNMVKLLEKGIAVHHSGILPILREMIEMMFDKGYIRLLIATETFAVGLNMPTKTVVFTNLQKFDGSTKRYLMSHEYTQQAGRAGRRGYDTKGTVIHLNNMFDLPSSTEYKLILNGKPQQLTSKFKISFNMILNMIYMKSHDVKLFSEKSILNNDIYSHSKIIENIISELNEKITTKKKCLELLRTPKDDIITLNELERKLPSLKNKQRKTCEREISQIIESNKFLKQDKLQYDELYQLENTLKNEYENLDSSRNYIDISTKNVMSILHNNNFIDEDNNILIKGIISCQLQEIHCLVFSDLLEYSDYFDNLNYSEIVGVLSCFTNINVNDDYKDSSYNNNNNVSKIVSFIKNKLDYYSDEELRYNTYTGCDYNVHYDLIDYCISWCSCSNENESKYLIQKIQQEKNIFLGEFIKAILKINNIVNELEKIANYVQNIPLLSKLNEIKQNTLKFVATTQSLYV